ncbi:MAG: hypothetical protein JW982_11775 [Spirochaetes bacterium]|nr:hypothetical protein [Spirochaetota bacterium]
MNLEQIIQESLEKMTADFEKRKSFFMSVLYKNIDQMARNSTEWFGESIPDEFKEVMSSLMKLSIAFYEDIDKYNDIFVEQTYEVFSPSVEIGKLIEKSSSLMNFNCITLTVSDELKINTSLNIFNDSIFSIILCMAQFFNNESKGNIHVEKEYTSVKILMNFTDLSKGINDFAKLTKPFFSTGDDMHLKVGLNIPFDNIKKIGGLINIYESNHFSDIQIIVSFPSDDFLKTVNDIRKIYVSSSEKKKSGNVMIIVSDKILELVLRDNLEDHGFSTEVSDIDKIESALNRYNPDYLIVYGNDIIKKWKSFDDFFLQKSFSIKTVIICSEKNKCIPDKALNPELSVIKFPFDIDELILKIKNE